jgi:hypothetical protein
MLLGLKILLTPLFMAALTSIARSRGSRVAGIVVGLPLTSGPVSVFLAVENGAAFSARAAVGAHTGVVGIHSFCAAYAVCARRASWVWALLGGTVACVGTVALLQRVTFSLSAAIGLAVLTTCFFTAVLKSLNPPERSRVHTTTAEAAVAPRWDLPVRVAVATLLVVTLTVGARRLGPGWSGALSSLPILTAVLAAFVQHHAGRTAAIAMLQAAIIGTLGSVAFFGAIGALLAPGTLVATHVVATAAAATLSTILAIARS